MKTLFSRSTIILAALLLSACGGGGDGGGGPPTHLAPIIADAAPVVATIGTEITPIIFTNASTAGSDGWVTTCRVSPSLPTGLRIYVSSGCVISGTPSATRTANFYTVTASNQYAQYGTDTALVRITVNPAPPAPLAPPVIANAAAVVAARGTAITDITFASSGGAIGNCTVSPPLPTGLTINTANCTITGTPSATKVATTYTVTASNATDSDTATVSLTVANRPSAPTNLVATPTEGAVGSATADKVTLTWDAVAGASGYTVYRATQSMALSTNNDPANLVGIYSATSTPATSTTHTTPKLDGKTYYFFVTSTDGTLESYTNAAQASAIPFATVTSPYTSRMWMSRNLGSTRDCTRIYDKACYGDLYQWGRAADGHQRINRSATNKCWNNANPSESVACTSLTTTVKANSITDTRPGINHIKVDANAMTDWVVATVDDSGDLRSAAWADGGVNDICPAGFSVPTIGELTADTLNASSPVTNATSAFTSFLKLPQAAYRNNDGYVYSSGQTYLWSRSRPASTTRPRIQIVAIRTAETWSTPSYLSTFPRWGTSSIRCIKVIAPVLANVTTAVTATNNTALANDITFTNTGGGPATCTVSPALPTGLAVEGSSCTIYGTPTATQSATTHTVTGTNNKGSDIATVSLTVN